MPEPMPQAGPPTDVRSRWRTIRIFISSTFQDMHWERDELNKVVFPALEERLRPRRCRLEPIDLRVGVETTRHETEHEKEVEILKVCLAEIELSRPFLIVLLGDRYGWVPGGARIRAAANAAGFEFRDQDASVTALEIEYGLLQARGGELAGSLVCLREPLPYQLMGDDLAATYSDAHAADDGALRRSVRLQALRAKLSSLPELAGHRLVYSLEWDAERQRPRSEGENGLRRWGKQVEAALWELLDAETAQQTPSRELSWQEDERFAIEEFVERLARGFVGRETVMQEASALATSRSQENKHWGACVVGARGVGKSALFARVHQELSKRGDLVLLAHAAGISPRGRDIDWMLRRWIAELRDATGTRQELPEDTGPEMLDRVFAALLHRAAKRRRVVLLVDALDQFIQTARSRTMSWLPTPWPANARLIVTSLPGEQTRYLAGRRRVAIIDVPPLAAVEADAVVRHAYARYHRRPNDDVVRALLGLRAANGTPAAGSPLWLTLSLDLLNQVDVDDFDTAAAAPAESAEARLHLMLMNRVRSLPTDVVELYGVLLQGMEKVVGREEARAFAALILLSRHGWRDADVRHLLGAAAGILAPTADRSFEWNALQFAVLRRCYGSHLTRCGTLGQWDGAHAALRQACDSYLSLAPSARRALHGAIADHLDSLSWDDPVARQEKMFHLVEHGDGCRAGKYFAEIMERGAGDGDVVREQVEPLAAALTAPDDGGAVASVLQWLGSIARDPDHGRNDKVAPFLVFVLDPLLDARRSAEVDRRRVRLLLSAQEAALAEDEELTERRQRETPILHLTPAARAKLERLEWQMDRSRLRLREGLLAVIQARLTAALREADPDAARAANARAVGHATAFEDADRGGPGDHSGAWDVTFFGAMVEAIGDGAIYLLPALRAACREGELLLEAGRYTDALPIFDAVIKGVSRLRGWLPDCDLLVAGSSLLAGDALLASGDAARAEDLCRHAVKRLEASLRAIDDNDKASRTFTFRVDGHAGIQAAFERFFARPRVEETKHHDWPTSDRWRYLIATAYRKKAEALVASGHARLALGALDHSRRVLAEILIRDPANTRYRFSATLSHFARAAAWASRGHPRRAVAALEEGLAVFAFEIPEDAQTPWMKQRVRAALREGERVLAAWPDSGKIGQWRDLRERLGNEDSLGGAVGLSRETGEFWVSNDAQFAFAIRAALGY